MPECDYCGESFADEAAYLEHLEATHEGELSRIDQRRVEGAGQAGEETTGLATYAAIAVVGAIVLGLGAFAASNFLGSSAPADDYGLVSDPSHPALDDVETFESTGRDHVGDSSQLSYDRVPPLSGAHLGDRWTDAGFYDSTPELGAVVHALEHGAVVVYYDPDAISPTAREYLRGAASEYTDNFASVIVAPHPADDPPAPYVFTAWEHRLQLSEWDEGAAKAFMSEYLGRGPERPVR